MEFDNDRKRIPTRKIEIVCWFFVVLLYPLANWLTVFYNSHILTLPLLVFCSLLVLPAYLFYSAVVVPVLLFKKRYIFFVLISAAVYMVVLAILTGIYSLLVKDSMLPMEHEYFYPSPRTIIRESLWVFANMSFAICIAFLKKSLGEELMLKDLQKDAIVLRLKYLRAQVKPHFLFNTLNSIYSLSLQKSDKTPEVIIKLADIMRYLIYASDEQKVLLSKEIEFIENYIEIERVRFKADVRFSVEGDTAGILIEPFLFISFIENAFKHALSDTFIQPFIYITIKVKGDEIAVTVVNNTDIDLETQAKRLNGRPITGSKGLLEMLYPDSYALNIIQTEKQDRKISSIGIKNARERLEILYPDSHTLDVIFNNNVFTVALFLKLDL